MTTTKKITEIDSAFDSTFELDFSQLNDTMDKLLIDVSSPNKTDDIEKFVFIINNDTPKFIPKLTTERVDTLYNTTPTLIYKFSFDSSEFITGKNTISLWKVTKDSADSANAVAPAAPVTPEDVVAKGSKFGLITFIFKEANNLINADVSLQRPGGKTTADQKLWDAIDNHFLIFDEYEKFIDKILCRSDLDVGYKKRTKTEHFDAVDPKHRPISKIRSPFVKSEEYNLIKFATEFYMLAKFGLSTPELKDYVGTSQKLPYYDLVIKKIRDDLRFNDNAQSNSFLNNLEDDCADREYERLFNPFMIELIWSYWMEQGMLVQTMNVINLRFQNIQGNHYMDRLMRFDTDPLRPLSHILWGYIQDEQHRLALPRRLSEYDHEYGLTLMGKAVPRLTPVDSRVKFLEAFHSLLTLCTIYFSESDDTTRIADAFPILHSLKEVHLLLAEGNHNAYGNLTWTARHEMMMQQYILSRPEMREFLGGRVMVPYPETWMDRVDTMRNIQGWGSTSIVYFYELAVHGELILLSIRYGNWSDVRLDRHNAANWAQRFRNSIQRYIHAYRVVTGVDLSVDQIIHLPNNYAVQPAFLIQQRLLSDQPTTAYLKQQQSLLLGRGRNKSA